MDLRGLCELSSLDSAFHIVDSMNNVSDSKEHYFTDKDVKSDTLKSLELVYSHYHSLKSLTSAQVEGVSILYQKCRMILGYSNSFTLKVRELAYSVGVDLSIY